ncbi:MAG: phosphate ABC transporter permease subunit PstC [Solirubrobacterales bacterium]|nr:phosphate ABC transporter permease subunit PstC [Solirubrobacterales bacterium]
MEAGTQVTGGVPGAEALGTRRRRWGEEAIRAALFAAALISILTTTGILFALLGETFQFFSEVPIKDFITDAKWSPLFADPQYGIWQLINGTFLITGIAVLIAIPLGLGSAVYLSEYATPRVRRIVKPILEVLVGVPTVVFGFFALSFVTPEIIQGVLGLDAQVFNALSAGLVMSIMVMPTIASISEDSMSAVPQGLREGAYGLGASRMQVSLRVVFPAALSGIVAACVLGVSRAVGETMIVLIAAGQIPRSGAHVLEPYETITTFIGATAKGDIPTGSIEYKTIFAAGTVLFLLTLLFNAIAIRFVRKYREVYD